MSARMVRLATRASKLALWQAHTVAAAIESAAPGTAVELVEVTTKGDRIKDVPLSPELGQSFFTREVEDAVRDGRADVAVHSCKDLATRGPDGLTLAAFPERADPRDALVGRGMTLMELPAGARVGTSSIRRRRFLTLARPDVEVLDLRGNVPTRVGAVDQGRMDAVVLAVAGLQRLELGHRITERLDTALMLPAAAQGALAVQIRDDDVELAALVAPLDHAATRAEVEAERAALRRLEAGCQSPVGALARADGGSLALELAVVRDDGQTRVRLEASTDDAEALGVRAAEAILERLGLTTLRDAPWAGPPPRAGPQPRTPPGAPIG